MSPLELVSDALVAVGAVFFLAGTVGLLRFPDVYTRLHASTKADNLGLGFVVAGLALQSGELVVVLKLGLTWAFVLLSSSLCGQLIAGAARADGVPPWSRR